MVLEKQRANKMQIDLQFIVLLSFDPSEVWSLSSEA